jgi:hypothetical protein
MHASMQIEIFNMQISSRGGKNENFIVQVARGLRECSWKLKKL